MALGILGLNLLRARPREREAGDAARDRRDWVSAVRHYERHLSRQSDDFAIWVQLGHARKERGDLSGALVAYKEALALEPEDADLSINLRALHDRMTALARATGSLEQRTTPVEASDRDAGDTARNLRDWASAILHYEKHVREHPRDFAIWVQLGHARKETGNLTHALAAYHEAYALNSGDSDLLLHLGHLHKKMANLPQAIRFYRDSLTVNDNLYARNELSALGVYPRGAQGHPSVETLTGPVAPNRQPTATLPDRMAVVAQIETHSGSRFRVPDHRPAQIFSYEPFAPMIVGSTISEYFLTEEALHSISLVFFTYQQANGSDLFVRLSSVTRDLELEPLAEVTFRGDEVADGKLVHVVLENPINNVRGLVFHISIEILNQNDRAMVTVAGIDGGVAALTLENGQVCSRSLAMQINAAPIKFGHKFWAFVSCCPGDAYRYRCVHQAESLISLGYGVDVFPPNETPWQYILDHYCVVTLHRVPHDDLLEGFLIEARKRGIVVIYDTDDLVFSEGHIGEIDAYTRMPRDEQAIYVDGVRRFNRAIAGCDIVSTSTNALRDAVMALWPEKVVRVARNAASREMVGAAQRALQAAARADRVVRIGYFSGTKTHQKDFEVCADALRWVLSTHSNVTLIVVGHLDVSELAERFPGQVETVSFVPWQSLPELYRSIDINLAPLEYGNTFTASKSELKWLEAGLLEIPTVASRVGAYEDVVRQDVDGILCSDTTDWMRALETLILDRTRRKAIGSEAKRRVEAFSTTTADPSSRQQELQALFKTYATQIAPRKPAIGFVLRAPIAQTGGGYKKIFMLASYLAISYDVTVYIDPIAHLEGKSDEYIAAFVSENFGFDGTKVVTGLHRISATDLLIATNWPTVNAVLEHPHARVRTYFVQDYEPEFYDNGSVEYKLAEETYGRDLALITIGRYLRERLEPYGRLAMDIPFAIDQSFFDAAASRSRKPECAPCRILFFARPNIPRRNFLLGVEALKLLSERCSSIEIALYGLENELDLGFRYTNLGIIDQCALAAEMAKADVHLSFSMTNVSTVIYEAMAAGCACVEADVASVRAMVANGTDCLLAQPNPEAVARALQDLVENAAMRTRIAIAGGLAVSGMTEGQMCRAFEEHLLRLWLVAGETR
jgi:glycosyltransferase involved in cell wall biosynthesis/tetratricopeptide (TPR) repeat protein